MTNTVSVVIPCYNYAGYLAGCVQSALAQDGVDVRVLVIDDASSDDSAQVAELLSRLDERVEVRVHAVNQGHIPTFNEGLTWASGDYTVLLSADDLLLPGALRRAVDAMNRFPRVGLVYGHAIRHRGVDRPVPRSGAPRRRVWPGEEWIRLRCRQGVNTICSPEVVVRTHLQREVGGYRIDLPHTGDLEMWMRLAARCDVLYLGGVDQAVYRIHAQSMSRTDFGSVVADLRERQAAFDAFFASDPPISEPDQLNALARRALAREALSLACRAYDRRNPLVPVDDLVAFATAACPDARQLPEYRGLAWRRSVGTRLTPYLQPLALRANLRAVRRRADPQLRRWRGV